MSNEHCIMHKSRVSYVSVCVIYVDVRSNVQCTRVKPFAKHDYCMLACLLASCLAG